MFTWSMANKSVHRCPPGRRPWPRRGLPEAAVTRGGGSGSGAGRAGWRAAAPGAGDAVAGFPGRCPAHEQAAGAEPGLRGGGLRRGAASAEPDRCPPSPPQLYYQVLNFGMIVSSALMIWKGLMVVTGSESPIVVVLR